MYPLKGIGTKSRKKICRRGILRNSWIRISLKRFRGGDHHLSYWCHPTSHPPILPYSTALCSTWNHRQRRWSSSSSTTRASSCATRPSLPSSALAETTPSRSHNSYYATQSVRELVYGISVFTLCALAQPSPTRLHARIRRLLGASLTTSLLQATLFPYFCAGTTAHDVVQVVQRLQKQQGVGSILYYVAEETGGEDATTVQAYREAMGLAARSGAGWVAVKTTCWIRTDLLERVSEALRRKMGPDDASLGDDSTTRGDAGMSGEDDDDLLHVLSPSDRTAWIQAQHRVQSLADEAQAANVRLIFDAEQWKYQRAIDMLVVQLQQRYNTATTAWVFHTYQCYRVDTLARLQRDLERAQQQRYMPGIKLVRGAYLEYERREAAARCAGDVVHASWEDTNECYHAAIELCEHFPMPLDVLCATHNKDSLLHAQSARENNEYGTLFRSAQLYGMMDHLTFENTNRDDDNVDHTAASKQSSSSSYQTSYKYLPYGPQHLTEAFLLRRAEENGAAVAAGPEIQVRFEELERRCRVWVAKVLGSST